MVVGEKIETMKIGIIFFRREEQHRLISSFLYKHQLYIWKKMQYWRWLFIEKNCGWVGSRKIWIYGWLLVTNFNLARCIFSEMWAFSQVPVFLFLSILGLCKEQYIFSYFQTWVRWWWCSFSDICRKKYNRGGYIM